MTLDRFRSQASVFVDPAVSAADAVGLTPNGVSVIAALTAVAAGASYYWAGPAAPGSVLVYLLGSVFVLLNGYFDVVDGALARAQGTDSDGGDLLDHVLDRYADIVIVVGLAVGLGPTGYLLGLAAVTGVLMTSYLGTQTQAVGLDRTYGGLVGRADRLAIVGVVGGLQALADPTLGPLTLVGWTLVFLAVVGHLTAAQRFWGAWGDLE